MRFFRRIKSATLKKEGISKRDRRIQIDQEAFFTRLITQYNSFNDHIQVYPLVYYKANPFTKFYIGMTDYMDHLDESGPNGFNGYKETDRQFFVKIQYLIRS